MKASRPLVLDANILLRGIFGLRIRDLLASHQETVEFFTPDVCIEEALRHIPAIAQHKRVDPVQVTADLHQLVHLCVSIVDRTLYEEYEEAARIRISARDPDDWPIVATALLLNAPIWTEDQDFFGCGVATWNSNSVEQFLRNS